MVAPNQLSLFAHYGLSVLGAAVILVIGWLIAGWAARLVLHYGKRAEHLDSTVLLVLSRLVRLTILAFTIIAVLNRFGVQTASIIAVLGAAGLAVGLALQGTLSNVAAGVMILVLRPLKVGQAVDINGTSGTVEDIDLFMTRLCSFDGVPTYLPNGQVWGNVIKNFSQSTTRRVDLILRIGYEDDVDKAMRILQEIVDGDKRVLKEPAPLIAINELAASSVSLLLRFWGSSDDFYQAQLDITKRVKERFDAEGISIPFPQQDVHLFQAAAAREAEARVS